MALIKRTGYGQVEPNHLSGIVTGQIYAQLPAASAITQLEQGQFVVYDYQAGEVKLTGVGEPMLVYNEEKPYDPKYQNHKDFVYKKTDFVDNKMYPRLIKTNVGDIFTTNSFGANTSNTAETVGVTLVVGDYLTVNTTTAFLEKASTQNAVPEADMVWRVVKVYTMPDGQPGVKIQRVK